MGYCGQSGKRGAMMKTADRFQICMKRDFNAWLQSPRDTRPVKTFHRIAREWNFAHQEAGAIKYGQLPLIFPTIDLTMTAR
jgi:hypothetical protein